MNSRSAVRHTEAEIEALRQRYPDVWREAGLLGGSATAQVAIFLQLAGEKEKECAAQTNPTKREEDIETIVNRLAHGHPEHTRDQLRWDLQNQRSKGLL
jgi:hypothetical protein